MMQNPEKSSPPNAGLSDEQKVDYPKVGGKNCSSTKLIQDKQRHTFPCHMLP